MPNQPETVTASDRAWHRLLVEGHKPILLAHRLFRYLPGPPRCKLCHNPFGGVGGKLVGLFGFKPSRKNPNLCARCCDALPEGGAEVDIAVLFADVRGSTALGEKLGPQAFAATLNRFYHAATEALIQHDAIVDKLIGDEVMALFIPGVCGPEYCRHAAEAAVALLRAVGYGQPRGPWIPIGAAVNSGRTYVGNVGGHGVVDFTALGDSVNTAARLASSAGAGEALLSETVYSAVAEQFPGLEQRTLALRGKDAPFAVRVCSPTRPDF
jgi:adenylate cyclase